MRLIKSQLDRCFDVIELLVETAGALRLSDIAERLDMPKSATHRLLAHLVQRGWVEQDTATEHYRLTLRLPILGQRFLLATGIADLCQPVLDRLAQRTRELVRMAVVERDGLTWIAAAQGAPAGLRYEPERTARVPLHVTANGKAWLATLPRERALRLASEHGLGSAGRFGPKAARTKAAFGAMLDQTAARGWALAQEEAEPGIVAIAAAVPGTGPGASPIGTVSVAGPVFRMTEEKLDSIAGSVVATATELGQLWPLKRAQDAVTAGDPARRVGGRAS